MTYRIEGWCIIDKNSGDRWGGLYESEKGAKQSYNSYIKRHNRYTCLEDNWSLFNEQEVYILQPLVLIEGENE